MWGLFTLTVTACLCSGVNVVLLEAQEDLPLSCLPSLPESTS